MLFIGLLKMLVQSILVQNRKNMTLATLSFCVIFKG